MKLSVATNNERSIESSFDVSAEVFIRGDIAINKKGVHMRDREKAFMVNFEELDLGEVYMLAVFPTYSVIFQIIGRGCSSYVQRGVHIPTQTQLALKVINLFDKGKRDQIMKEIELLYDAMCPT